MRFLVTIKITNQSTRGIFSRHTSQHWLWGILPVHLYLPDRSCDFQNGAEGECVCDESSCRLVKIGYTVWCRRKWNWGIMKFNRWLILLLKLYPHAFCWSRTHPSIHSFSSSGAIKCNRNTYCLCWHTNCKFLAYKMYSTERPITLIPIAGAPRVAI